MNTFRLARTLLAPCLLAAALSSCQTVPDADFLAADANKDRAIDKAELDQHVANRFMRSYDSNKDGGITFAEWKAVYPEADRAKYQRRDTDKNGKITMPELLVVLREHPTFGNLMQTLDKNGDKLVQPSEAKDFQKHMTEL